MARRFVRPSTGYFVGKLASSETRPSGGLPGLRARVFLDGLQKSRVTAAPFNERTKASNLVNQQTSSTPKCSTSPQRTDGWVDDKATDRSCSISKSRSRAMRDPPREVWVVAPGDVARSAFDRANDFGNAIERNAIGLHPNPQKLRRTNDRDRWIDGCSKSLGATIIRRHRQASVCCYRKGGGLTIIDLPSECDELVQLVVPKIEQNQGPTSHQTTEVNCFAIAAWAPVERAKATRRPRPTSSRAELRTRSRALGGRRPRPGR